MGTKQNPGAFDCYQNALPHEPMFVLLARDPRAPALVLRWAQQRNEMIEKGERPRSDEAMVVEAIQCAEAMVRWRIENDGCWRRPQPAALPEAQAGVAQEHTVDGVPVAVAVPARMICPDCGAGSGEGCWSQDAEGSCPPLVEDRPPQPPRPEVFWDDSETDGTDFAHPAWWRGNQRGVETVAADLTALLDGQEPQGTVGLPILQKLRERMWSLRQYALRTLGVET